MPLDRFTDRCLDVCIVDFITIIQHGSLPSMQRQKMGVVWKALRETGDSALHVQTDSHTYLLVTGIEKAEKIVYLHARNGDLVDGTLHGFVFTDQLID